MDEVVGSSIIIERYNTEQAPKQGAESAGKNSGHPAAVQLQLENEPGERITSGNIMTLTGLVLTSFVQLPFP